MARFRVLAATMAIVGIASGGCADQNSPPPEAQDAGPEATRAGAHEECEPEFVAEYAFSASDDSDLVGFSDNVFVGRVAERVGTTPPTPARPAGGTRFSVEILENVKGRLGGVVTVSQGGSYDPERGCATLLENDPLLKPGQEVMFFTRRDDEGRGWHRIVSAGYGDVRIENEEHRGELVRRFERAQKFQTDPSRGTSL